MGANRFLVEQSVSGALSTDRTEAVTFAEFLPKGDSGMILGSPIRFPFVAGAHCLSLSASGSCLYIYDSMSRLTSQAGSSFFL